MLDNINIEKIDRVERIENLLYSISKEEYFGNYHDAPRFIELCKRCKNYKTRWSCPPYDNGENSIIYDYDYIYIVGTKIFIDKDKRTLDLSKEDMKSACKEILLPIRQQLDKILWEFEQLSDDRRSFYAGSCVLCGEEKCSKESGEPCRKPEKVRFSLESVGFDIEKTTSDLLGVELKWGGEAILPEYFTLVSAIFSKTEIASCNACYNESKTSIL